MNFLLSIFLNLAKTEPQKEEVVKVLSKLQEDLEKDQEAQQKFFSIFSILKNLTKMITIEKSYEEFFNQLDTYAKIMSSFMRGSIATMYLLRDHVIELSQAIVQNIIKNQGLDKTLRKKGVVGLLKLGVCFKLIDLHFLFLENLLENDFQVNVKEELVTFFNEALDYSQSFDWSVFEEKPSEETTITIDYNSELMWEEGLSHTTDGKYLFIHLPSSGLFKVGTGLHNTIRGKVYAERKDLKKSIGSLAFACGRIYFRAPNIQKAFIVIDPQNLDNVPVETETNHIFLEEEKSEVKLTYLLKGHELIDPKRASGRSKIFSEGRFLYIISKIGELKLTDENMKGFYPAECLINVDVIDPLQE